MSSEAPKAVRKSHKKSRGGCLTCKGRRVKCDETRPLCLNCSRRSTACSWPATEPPVNPRVARATMAKRPKSFDMSSLAIMHHFTTSTSSSFHDSPAYTLTLQNSVPQLAMSHDFLMHGLFAITNLHLHYLHSTSNNSEGRALMQTKYFEEAESHYRQAVRGFMATEQPPLSEVNLMANVFFSTYLFARPTSETDLNPPSLIEWLPKARSFLKAVYAPWHAAEVGQTSSAIVPASDLPLSPEAKASYLMFPDYLQDIHLPNSGTPDMEEVLDPTVSQAYSQALQSLMSSWTVSHVEGMNRLSAIAFPSSIPDEFVDFIVQRRPRAMVILAHYCALITQFSDAWWIRNRGESDLRYVMQNLDTRWSPWLRFPISVMQGTHQWSNRVSVASLSGIHSWSAHSSPGYTSHGSHGRPSPPMYQDPLYAHISDPGSMEPIAGPSTATYY